MAAGSEGSCKGFGSGFFITRQGDILTSAHVVEGCSRLAVRGADGRVYAGRVSVVDGAYDLALLRVDGEVPAVAAFSAEGPAIPSRIAVVGFPETKATLAGASSSEGQLLSPHDYTQNRGLIVFNAEVAQGSSGGPIVDDQGRVIGVVFARVNSVPGVYLGIGSEAVRHFLDRQAMNYRLGRASTTNNFDAVLRSAISYTVFVQCLS